MLSDFNMFEMEELMVDFVQLICFIFIHWLAQQIDFKQPVHEIVDLREYKHHFQPLLEELD